MNIVYKNLITYMDEIDDTMNHTKWMDLSMFKNLTIWMKVNFMN
jgi:hypothetical protein